jgi:hypothetical protein
MEKVYFLSEDFDYSKKIVPDTGPEQAERNGWKKESIDNLGNYNSCWKIVDNRISKRECKIVKKVIKEKESKVFLVVVDPYREWCEGEEYYKMMYEMAGEAYFLSKYEPSEISAEIKEIAGEERFIVIPYSYNEEREVKIDWSKKREEIFFSGNQDKKVYPYRHMFNMTRKYWFPLYGRVKKLEHPGYPDIGEDRKHDVIGERYIEKISRHQFMFISPSRCRLEFLKYGECAAAGSVPVGMPPDGFTSEMRDPFVELDFSSYPALIRSTHALFEMSEEERSRRATEFRRVMKKYRSPDRLNKKLDAFIEQAQAH